MAQILNGRYEILDITNLKKGAQGVVFFANDNNENGEKLSEH